MVGLAHISRPCSACPWRKDSEPQKFTAERYASLRATSRQVDERGFGHDPLPGDPLFACHMTKEGREQACAGWLAVEGGNHVAVRLVVATGRMDPEALTPKPDWPALHENYDALVAHQGYEEPNNEPEAIP